MGSGVGLNVYVSHRKQGHFVSFCKFLRLSFKKKMGTNLKFVKHLLVPDSVEPPSSVQTKLNSQNPEMPSGCLGGVQRQLAGLSSQRDDKPLGF